MSDPTPPLAIPDELVDLAADALGGNEPAARVALEVAGPALVAAELRRLADEFDELYVKWDSVDDDVRASVYSVEAAALRARAYQLDPEGGR